MPELYRSAYLSAPGQRNTQQATMKRRGGGLSSGTTSGTSDAQSSHYDSGSLSASSAHSGSSAYKRNTTSARQAHDTEGFTSGGSSATEIVFGVEDEKNSKSDKMREAARKRRRWLLRYLVPRAACCALFLVVLRGLAYRMTDDVILPNKDSVLPLPRTLQQSQMRLQLHEEQGTALEKAQRERFSEYRERRDLQKETLLIGKESLGDGIVDAGSDSVKQTNLGFGRHHVVTEGLLHHALVKASNEYGPRAPQRTYRGTHGPLTDIERQGHVVKYVLDKDGGRSKITDCKEYLGDHIHCKPTLDMSTLRSVQTHYGMSDKLFESTISQEKAKWKGAFEVGLSTSFMRDRLVEVARSYLLKPRRPDLLEDAGDDLDASHGPHSTDVSLSEHTWRYKNVIRKAAFKRTSRSSEHNGEVGNEKALAKPSMKELDLNPKGELTKDQKDTAVYYLVQNLQKFYRLVGHPRHETACYQIAFKYLKRHNLLERLIHRLETKYGVERVAPFLYPIRAGIKSMKETGKWPGEEERKNARMARLKETDVEVSDDELKVVNGMLEKLRKHRVESAGRKDADITVETCVFSKRNRGSPCHRANPCAQVHHTIRTKEIILKCFWKSAKDYCKKSRSRFERQERQKMLLENTRDNKHEGKKYFTRHQVSEDSNIQTQDTHTINKLESIHGASRRTKSAREDSSVQAHEEGRVHFMRGSNHRDQSLNENVLDEVDSNVDAGADEDYDDGNIGEAKGARERKRSGDDDDADDADDADDDDDDDEEEDIACDYIIGVNATLQRALTYFQNRGLKPEWDIRKETELKEKQASELAAKEARAKLERKRAALMPKRDAIMADKLENYEAIHKMLGTKVKKSLKLNGLAGKLEKWYIDHGMQSKAEDRPHLLELSEKYADHPDLLFKRLAMKYHTIH